jgi:hypothetical protein
MHENKNKWLVIRVLCPIIILHTWLVLVGGPTKTKLWLIPIDQSKLIIIYSWTLFEKCVANRNGPESHHIREWFSLAANFLTHFRDHH